VTYIPHPPPDLPLAAGPEGPPSGAESPLSEPEAGVEPGPGGRGRNTAISLPFRGRDSLPAPPSVGTGAGRQGWGWGQMANVSE